MSDARLSDTDIHVSLEKLSCTRSGRICFTSDRGWPMARVLLAEANRRIGDFIAGILAEFGHEVTMCADAAEADARLAVTPIDVVLTDAVLGGGADEAFGRNWQARGIPTIT